MCLRVRKWIAGVESLGAHGWVSEMSQCLICWRMRNWGTMGRKSWGSCVG